MPNGNVLNHDANYDGSVFGNLALETPRPLGAQAKLKKDLAGEFLRRRGKEPPTKNVWIDTENRRFTSFAICNQTLLATGHTENSADKPFLVAIDIADGSELWKHGLAAEVGQPPRDGSADSLTGPGDHSHPIGHLKRLAQSHS